MPPSMGGQHSSITINNGISNGKSNSGGSVGKNKGPKKHFSLFYVWNFVKIELKRYCIPVTIFKGLTNKIPIEKNYKKGKKKNQIVYFHWKFEL